MIAVDTSALIAIVAGEPDAERCMLAIEREPTVMISAGTVSEALVVAARRKITPEVTRLFDDLGLTVVPVTAAVARQVGEAYARWGKGLHPAGLNFGDCFAYAVAREHGCPLLYVGNDFSQTDLPPQPI